MINLNANPDFVYTMTEGDRVEVDGFEMEVEGVNIYDHRIYLTMVDEVAAAKMAHNAAYQAVHFRLNDGDDVIGRALMTRSEMRSALNFGSYRLR